MRPRVEMDLGGTWLRRRMGGHLDVEPSVSRLNRPDADVVELLTGLVDQLVRDLPPDADVAISCGAALDERDGSAYGSGPLWGSYRGPVPLGDMLRDRRPDVCFRLVNDVTAALVDFCEQLPSVQRIGDYGVAYVTVSSGVALRTARRATRTVPVDGRGLQGEIGHLRAAVPPGAGDAATRAELGGLYCECGGPGHVAALAAGPAFARVASVLGVAASGDLPAGLRRRLDACESDAARVLRVCVAPIAEIIRTIRTLDPDVAVVGVGGGVATGLGRHYEAELVRQLCEPRSYADPQLEPAHVRTWLRVCRTGEIDPLEGARAVADGHWQVLSGERAERPTKSTRRLSCPSR